MAAVVSERVTVLNFSKARRDLAATFATRALKNNAAEQVARMIEDLYTKRQASGLTVDEEKELRRLAELQKRNLGAKTTS